MWGYRLQATWIGYTATYIILGEFVGGRAMSSLMATLGGGLIAATMLLAMVEQDRERIRSVLLVVMGASAFLSVESAKVYADNTAAILSAGFTLMVGHLLWSGSGALVGSRACHRYYMTVVLIVSLSLTQLGMTVVLQFLIRNSFIDGTYVFAPHGTGIALGLGVGLAHGAELSRGLAPRPLRGWGLVVGSVKRLLVVFLPLFAMLTMANSDHQIRCFGRTWDSLTFAFCYSLVLATCISLALQFCLVPRSLPARWQRGVVVGLLVPLVTSTVIGTIILGCYPGAFERTYASHAGWALCELLPLTSLCIVMVTTIWCGRWAVARTREGLVGST